MPRAPLSITTGERSRNFRRSDYCGHIRSFQSDQTFTRVGSAWSWVAIFTPQKLYCCVVQPSKLKGKYSCPLSFRGNGVRA